MDSETLEQLVGFGVIVLTAAVGFALLLMSDDVGRSSEEGPTDINDRLIRQSNLYHLRRHSINTAVVVVVICLIFMVDKLTGVLLGAGWILKIFKTLRALWIKRVATPKRLILFLRPFGSRHAFELLPPLLKAAAPFGRVVGLARSAETVVNDSRILSPRVDDFAEAATVASRIRAKDVDLKFGTLLQCSDAEWKSVILSWLSEASLVVIDAGKIGNGLAWEIETVCERFGPDEVIFCVPEQSEAPTLSGARHSDHDLLAAILQQWHPARRRIVMYPNKPPVVDHLTVQHEVTGRIVAQIVQCLALLERSHIFCGECGHRIKSDADRCPLCGTPSWKQLSRPHAFCEHCGQPRKPNVDVESCSLCGMKCCNQLVRPHIFCGDCGQAMNSHVRYCPRCGTRSWKLTSVQQ